MSLSVSLLFDAIRNEFASELERSYENCLSTALVSGFVTVEGINTILSPIRRAPSKVATLVVGAATWRGLDAFDELLALGIPAERLLIHLGHSRRQSSPAKHSFARYHPMLHSKAYLFDMPGDRSVAYIGSHNLTGFALNGLNGEASVRLEGPSSDPTIRDVRAHIASAASEATVYDPNQKTAYAWWTLQLAEGLKDKFNDSPRDTESERTIVILAQSDRVPKADD